MLSVLQRLLALVVVLVSTGTALATPVVEVSQGGQGVARGSTFNFGPSPLGAPVSRTFVITNTGTTSLTIGAVAITAGNYTVTQQPTSVIAPSGTTSFTVRMNASTQGVQSGQFAFANTDPARNPFFVSLTGSVTAPAPEIEVRQGGLEIVDGGSFPFGSTSEGAPLERIFTVNNIGSLTLSLGAVATTTGYTVTQQPNFTIGPGGSTTFRVRLNAQSIGVFNGQIAFANNDSNENPFNFLISGTVTAPAPEIEVTQSGNDVPRDSTFAFGSIGQGFPISRQFLITNAGTQALTVGTVSVPNGFTVTTQPMSPVAPGGSTGFTVEFTGANLGNFSGNLSFNNNDSNESPYRFLLTGQVTPPAPRILVVVDGQEIPDGGAFGFGTTPEGAPLTKEFTILNTGSAELVLGAISLPSSFILDTAPATPVPIGGQTTFRVTFPADTRGGFSGPLSFSTNDTPRNPFNFSIGASATQPAPSITVLQGATEIIQGGSFNMGATVRGVPVVRTFTIENRGSRDLIVDRFKVPSRFTISGPATTTISPGGSTTFDITFPADRVGVSNGNLQFRTNVSGLNPFRFVLLASATAPAPEVDLLQGGGPIPSGGGFNFGTTATGVPLTATFEIQNNGSADLTIKKVKAPKGYALLTQPALTLPPGGSTTFDVQLTAVKRGTIRGTLQFGTNDSDEKKYIVQLQGVVNDPATFDGPPADEPAVFVAEAPGTSPNLAPLEIFEEGFDAPLESSVWTMIPDEDKAVALSLAAGEFGLAPGERAAEPRTGDVSLGLASRSLTFGLSHDLAASIDYRAFSDGGASSLDLGVILRWDRELGTALDAVDASIVFNEEGADLRVNAGFKGTDAGEASVPAPDEGRIYLWYLADEDRLYISTNGYEDPNPIVVPSLRVRAGSSARATIRLGAGTTPEAGELDGVVAGFDNLVVYGSRREPMVGDVNADGMLTQADLQVVIEQIGRTGDRLLGDVDGDGVVTIDDLAIVTQAVDGR